MTDDSYEAWARWITSMAALEEERGPIEIGGTSGSRTLSVEPVSAPATPKRSQTRSASQRSRSRLRYVFQVTEREAA